MACLPVDLEAEATQIGIRFCEGAEGAISCPDLWKGQ